MATIAGWAAHITDALKPYAPFSWVVAAFLGAAIAIYALYQKARLWAVNRSVEFYKNPDRINPLDNTFQSKRILISDLISPIENVIRNKTFIDCEIMGPSNIFFSGTRPGSTSINGAEWVGCSVVIVKENVQVSNCIKFEDCNILRGKLFLIMFLLTEIGIPGGSFDAAMA